MYYINEINDINVWQVAGKARAKQSSFFCFGMPYGKRVQTTSVALHKTQLLGSLSNLGSLRHTKTE